MILLLTLFDGERMLVNADDIGSIYAIAKAIRKRKRGATMMFTLFRKPKDPATAEKEKPEPEVTSPGFRGIAEKVDREMMAMAEESEPHFALVRVDDIRNVREVELSDVRVRLPKDPEEENRMPGRLVKGEFLIPGGRRR